MEILPKLYRAARHAYSNSAAAKDGPLMEIDLMRHSKALLILCPDMLTAWNSRKMVLSVNYDFTKLKDELQLCALILSCSPKNESTWSHRRWVIKKVSEHNQDVSELIERESVLVKEIAEKSKMNYRAWRHRCWLIPYMTREQVLNELKKSTRWNELHVADNCCFHYRRSLLLALLDSCHVEDTEDSLDRKSEVHLLWKVCCISLESIPASLWFPLCHLSLCFSLYICYKGETRLCIFFREYARSARLCILFYFTNIDFSGA
ncbi:protein prenyltransferase alpha subunit-like [Oryza sativa Japonica Group]|uniref:Os01g0684800 protein n=3 Tax=Oryza sativa subsp. japonica TaxID=39947 RepID=Q5N8P5_ORYSJ|nr:protein prenyltransferase alpha subunit-like [Oryza sativa Japonica Group]BAD82514.1 protein prenyltransferase alpha subunit-like [Oryza sativa Japonica Group]BAF05806.2 Os01g0684800 [Oryza sativa Japonica Group]BAG93498.1 unnamed protein product [Oryza sativa Japonica Group]|eukprot:NP_001043892.2 Os01g0684800 [Oryza sativa Japonica Group]